MTEETAPEDTGLVEVVAAVNLAGFRAGTTALVDPRQPYIASLLKAGYIATIGPVSAPVPSE